MGEKIELTEDKDGRLAVGIIDLLSAILNRYGAKGNTERDEFFNEVFHYKEFNEALKEYLIHGDKYGNEERRPREKREGLAASDVTRKVVLEALKDSTLELVTGLLEREASLFEQIEDLKEHIKKIEKLWPKSHEQYKPQRDLFYPSVANLDLKPIAQKLIEEAKKTEGEAE